MEGHPQLVRFLKALQRRGFAKGKGLSCDEFKDLRLRYSLPRELLASYMNTSADVLAQSETLGKQRHLDGGLYTALVNLVKQLPTKPKPVLEVPVVVFEPIGAPVAPVEQVVEEHPPASTIEPALARILARVAAMDLSASDLKTVDQRFQRVIQFWVKENKIRRFTMSKATKFMLLPKNLREAVVAITGGLQSQFLDNWRLFRHVKLKTKHKMALDSVLIGDVGAASALSEYDEKGRRSTTRLLRRQPKTKTKKPKHQPKSGAQRIQALSESNAAIPAYKSSSKRKTQKDLRIAQDLQDAVGAFQLKLAAIKTESSADSQIAKWIEGMTLSVGPIHHKIKAHVLLCVTKSKTK